jgi:hypothetical protein
MKNAIPGSAVVLSPFLSQYCFLHEFAVVNDINFAQTAVLEEFIAIYSIEYILIEKGMSRLEALIDDPDRRFRLHSVLTHDNLVLYRIETGTPSQNGVL